MFEIIELINMNTNIETSLNNIPLISD